MLDEMLRKRLASSDVSASRTGDGQIDVSVTDRPDVTFNRICLNTAIAIYEPHHRNPFKSLLAQGAR